MVEGAHAQAKPQTAASVNPGWHTGRVMVLLGGAALMIGALLPWASITTGLTGTISIPGYQGDDLISGLIGVILVIYGLLSPGKPGKTYYSPIGGLLAILSGVFICPKFVTVAGAGNEFAISMLGSGLFVSSLGIVMGMIGGFLRVPGEAPENIVSGNPDNAAAMAKWKRGNIIGGVVIAVMALFLILYFLLN